eukprot:3308232-Pleurochrysis_carterae.AAC.1
MSTDRDRKKKLFFTNHSTSLASAAVVKPLNWAPWAHTLLERPNVSLTIDNESLFQNCRRDLDIVRPTHTNLDH